MSARMEMIYIDDEGNARKTGIGAIMDTDQATLKDFLSRKPLEVPKESARFLLDYYDSDGNLHDTIALSMDGFRQITGERVLTDAPYKAIDEAYWADLRAELTDAYADHRNAIAPAAAEVRHG